MKKEPSLFISHSWEDKFFVGKFAERLSEYGVKVWVDEAELKIGDSLLTQISYAIKSTEYFAVVLSSSSVSSNWVQKELELAMTQEISGRKIKVLPLVIENCQLPYFLQDKVYGDFTNPDNFEKTFDKVLRAIGVDLNSNNILEKKDVDVRNTSDQELEKRESEIIANMEETELVDSVEISILKINKDKTYRPSKDNLLYNIYLLLSDHPPNEWVGIFNEERRFPRHTMWRKAWIEDEYIVIYCPLDEFRPHHLDFLKEDVKNTNIKYRQYQRKQYDQTIKKNESILRENDAIESHLGDIDFN